MAFALYAQPWLIQPVAFGIFGLGLLIHADQLRHGARLHALLDRRLAARQWRCRLGLAGRHAGAVVLAACAWVGLGAALLGQAAVPGASVRVAAINRPTHPAPGRTASTLFGLSRQAAAEGAQLIVWPGDAQLRPALGAARALQPATAASTGARLVLGYGYRARRGIVNEATVVAPAATFCRRSAKITRWCGWASRASRAAPTFHATPLGRLGTVILYDLNFTSTSRNMYANGAQRSSPCLRTDWRSKQYTNLVLRAVENRVTLIKADGNYDSAIIGPSGAIVARKLSTALPLRALLVADVPIGRANAAADPPGRLGRLAVYRRDGGVCGARHRDGAARAQQRLG